MDSIYVVSVDSSFIFIHNITITGVEYIKLKIIITTVLVLKEVMLETILVSMFPTCVRMCKIK